MSRAVTSVVPDPERHVALTEEHLDLAAAEQPLHLAEALGADEHLLALGEHAHTRQVADREPVRVGRDETHPVAVDAVSSTPVRIGRASSLRRRGHHLAQRLGERPRLDGAPPRLGLSGSRGKSLGRRASATSRPEPAGLDLRVVTAELHASRCRPRGGRRMSANSRAGSTALPSPSHLGRRLHPDRQLEVGADELDAGRR